MFYNVLLHVFIFLIDENLLGYKRKNDYLPKSLHGCVVVKFQLNLRSVDEMNTALANDERMLIGQGLN